MGLQLSSDMSPMERELEYLLYDLCVQWGFCVPSASVKRICTLTDLTAEMFVESVVRAGELDPQYERKYVRRIAAKFRERFGQDHISKDIFVDRIRDHKENWDM